MEQTTYKAERIALPTRADVDAACETITRYYSEHPLTVRDGSASVTCEKDAKALLMGRLADEEREVFCCLFLDTRHRVIAFERLFFGSVDRATVHPREVLKAALKCNAGAVILAHNHPSGKAEPSAADVELTRRLTDLLGELDVRVLDHVVVAPGHTVSMAARGMVG